MQLHPDRVKQGDNERLPSIMSCLSLCLAHCPGSNGKSAYGLPCPARPRSTKTRSGSTKTCPASPGSTKPLAGSTKTHAGSTKTHAGSTKTHASPRSTKAHAGSTKTHAGPGSTISPARTNSFPRASINMLLPVMSYQPDSHFFKYNSHFIFNYENLCVNAFIKNIILTRN